jgi:hypothetical protein
MTTAKIRRKVRVRRRAGRPPKPGLIREPNGRKSRSKAGENARREQQESEAAVIETATTARLRQMGMRDTEENRAEAKSPMLSCAVGRRLHKEGKGELMQAVYHMRRTVLAYDRAIGAPNRHAQCLRILTPAEGMHADASSPAIDTRTDEDKQRQAVSAWMALHGWLGYTDGPAKTACLRAVVDEPEQPLSNWPGILRALRCVLEGVKGQRIVVRMRK